MKINMFIASSINEFEDVRKDIVAKGFLINTALDDEGIDCFVNPILSEHELNVGAYREKGSQEYLDDQIRESDVIAVLLGSGIGEYTLHEINIVNTFHKRAIYFLDKTKNYNRLQITDNDLVYRYETPEEITVNLYKYIFSKCESKLDIKIVDNAFWINDNRILSFD